jgi:Asp-tRNA(Asn)/Glu-tRNA(Gln) amidotransferase C subunit
LDVAVSTRLAEIDFIAPDNDSIADILTKVDTLENTDLTGIATATNVTDAKDEIIAELANIDVDLTGVALEATSQDILTAVNNIDVDFTPVLDAVDLTLKAADYVAPDNATIAEIQTKVDTLENTDLTGIATATDVTNAQTSIEAKIDAIPVTDLTGITDDLTIINENVKDASLFIPATRNL